MPAHDVMQELEKVYYQSHTRGLRIVLGERQKVQFDQGPSRPWLAHITINERDDDGKLRPIEAQWKLVRKLEKTKAFEKGEIAYVPSPAELRKRAKREEQEKACLDLKESLQNELVVLPLDTMDKARLKALSDKIGVETTDKGGKEYTASHLRNAIAGKLDISSAPEPEVEPDTPAADVQNFVASKQPRGRKSKKEVENNA